MSTLKMTIPAEIDNDELTPLGALRIDISKIDNPTENTQRLKLVMRSSTTLKIVGDGSFTDSSLYETSVKELNVNAWEENTIYISNGDCSLLILNKYDISVISAVDTSGKNHKHWSINVEDISFADRMSLLNLTGFNAYGEFKSLISSKSIDSVTYLYLANSGLDIDLCVLSGTKKLRYIDVSGINVSGDVECLAGNTGLEAIVAKEADGIYGDLSTLNLKWISCESTNNQNFSWKSERGNDKFVTAMSNIYLGEYVDDALIALASSTFQPISSADYAKIIRIKGTRSSSSDSAVAIIKSNGWKVFVNGIEL